MNNTESGPGFELPAMPVESNESQNSTGEVMPAKPEAYKTPAQPKPTSPVTTTNQPLVPVVDPVVNNGTAAVSAHPMPPIADDNDLIEKEWVLKAKQIVSATKNDPYRQNVEMSKIKADYLKKRYNKDIKVEDS